MLKSLLIIILLPAACLGQLIDEDILPFGGHAGKRGDNTAFFTLQRLAEIHDSLGINQWSGYGFEDTTDLKRFVDAGIYVYPIGATHVAMEAQMKFSNATYFTTHPDSNEYYSVKFRTIAGNQYQDSLWLYAGSGVMLDSLKMLQRNDYDFLDGSNPIYRVRYYPILKIGAYTSGLDDSVTIGIFTAWNLDLNTSDSTRFIDTIRVENLPAAGDTILSLTNRIDTLGVNYYHVLPDPGDSTKQMLFQFETTGACSVYVDYFQVHCQYGLALIEDHEYDELIYESVSRPGYDGRIRGWFLIDSPRRGSFASVAYIDNLIQDTTSGWTYPTWGPALISLWSSGSDKWVPDGYRDYERICRPKELWAYLFPIALETSYTGYSSPRGLYLQSAFELYVTDACDSIAQALKDYDSSFSWSYWPQFWYCNPSDECTGGETRRKPTPPEMLCMTYIGMCYHPKSIIFWRYDTVRTGFGIVDANGNPRAGMYDVVRDKINPYLKAIDGTYLGLSWLRAYAYHQGTPDRDPVEGSIVSSITTWSNPDTANPDSGWYHVGEFEDSTTGDKYLMLVNRACNIDSVTLAPSVTATVRFDATNLGLGDYVYIIDLADSLRLAGADTGWVGIPDTTYSAMLDGTIPFTTVLGPGEGRLFKLVQAR